MITGAGWLLTSILKHTPKLVPFYSIHLTPHLSISNMSLTAIREYLRLLASADVVVQNSLLSVHVSFDSPDFRRNPPEVADHLASIV